MKKKSSPLVSVLIPIYNVEKYLRECIDSVVSQTLADLEIILINDGSKDTSLEIINEYASKDPRVKVINKNNSGYGDSMNRGLEVATGKYIGIVESDDYVESDMFETLYNIAENNNLDIVRSEFFYYSTKNGIKNDKSNTTFVPHDVVLRPKDNVSVFMQQPSIWANLYLRSFLNEHNITFLNTPGASYQDTSFSFKVYACAERFLMISKAFYHYRIDGGSSSFQNNTKVYCVCDEYHEIWDYVTRERIYDDYKALIPMMQYAGYKWNYNRLTSPYSEEFFNRWHEEFLELNNNGLIDLKRYSENDQKLIRAVLNNECTKKDKPWVSIIVPVYNVESFLPKCLDSLINQTLTNIEIICVNDGSTDGSRDILRLYEKRDMRIKVIDKPNGGLSSARNAGIDAATADLIGFVDSDDWVEPDTYESAYYSLGDCDLVCFGTNVTGEAMLDRRADDIEYYRVKYEGLMELTDEIRLNVDVAAWNKLYRRELIQNYDIRFPEGMLYEDYSFYWKYISVCKKVFFIKDLKYNYLRRNGSIMAKTFGGNQRAIEHLMIFPDIYAFNSNTDTLKESTINSMFLNCFWFAYLNVPYDKKKKVMKLGTKIVRKFNLKNDIVIDALSNKEYAVVDTHMDYTFGNRFLVSILGIVERKIGGDFSSLKKMIYGTKREYTDSSDSVATTEWVNQHEQEYWIEKWGRVYDSYSKSSDLNWNQPCGLVGRDIRIPDQKKIAFTKGTELKIELSLWNTEVATVRGTILNEDRTIWGTSIFDGSTLFNISVDLHDSHSLLTVYAVSEKDLCDYSKDCKILRIESRLYS